MDRQRQPDSQSHAQDCRPAWLALHIYAQPGNQCDRGVLRRVDLRDGGVFPDGGCEEEKGGRERRWPALACQRMRRRIYQQRCSQATEQRQQVQAEAGVAHRELDKDVTEQHVQRVAGSVDNAQRGRANREFGTVARVDRGKDRAAQRDQPNEE